MGTRMTRPAALLINCVFLLVPSGPRAATVGPDPIGIPGNAPVPSAVNAMHLQGPSVPPGLLVGQYTLTGVRSSFMPAAPMAAGLATPPTPGVIASAPGASFAAPSQAAPDRVAAAHRRMALAELETLAAHVRPEQGRAPDLSDIPASADAPAYSGVPELESLLKREKIGLPASIWEKKKKTIQKIERMAWRLVAGNPTYHGEPHQFGSRSVAAMVLENLARNFRDPALRGLSKNEKRELVVDAYIAALIHDLDGAFLSERSGVPRLSLREDPTKEGLGIKDLGRPLEGPTPGGARLYRKPVGTPSHLPATLALVKELRLLDDLSPRKQALISWLALRTAFSPRELTARAELEPALEVEIRDSFGSKFLEAARAIGDKILGPVDIFNYYVQPFDKAWKGSVGLHVENPRQTLLGGTFGFFRLLADAPEIADDANPFRLVAKNLRAHADDNARFYQERLSPPQKETFIRNAVYFRALERTGLTKPEGMSTDAWIQELTRRARRIQNDPLLEEWLQSRLPRLKKLGFKQLIERVDHLHPTILSELLERVEASVRNGQTPVVVFDLDDTLFDTSHRFAEVVRAFARSEGFKNLFFSAQERDKVRQRLLRAAAADVGRDSSLGIVLKNLGLENEGLLAAFKNFWNNEFFEGSRFTLDQPTPGAAAYLQALVERGAVIVYLTARWKTVEEATIDSLARGDLPTPDGKKVLLIMKTNRGMSQTDYKESSLNRLAEMGQVVGLFDNEPTNVNLFRSRFPDAFTVFVQTRHPHAGISPDWDIPWIEDFRFDPAAP